MIKDRKSFCLMMYVIRRRHTMASSDDAQSSISNRLESTLDQSWFNNGTPYTRGIRIRRANIEAEGVKKS